MIQHTSQYLTFIIIMLQEQRRKDVSPPSLVSSTVTSSVSSSVNSDISVIHERNKMDLIQNYFDEAKKYVNRALKSDEKKDTMTALELYNKALTSIKSGLGIIKSSPQVSAGMKELKEKMEKVKGQVKSRMTVLLQEEESHRMKGTDSQTKSISSSMGMRTSDGKGGGGRENGKSTVGAEAEVIFSSSKGCRIVHVNDSGCVLKCTSADALHIFKYKHPIPGQPPAFLQCGDFVYPLIPGQSPILRSSHMAYVFPDIQTEGHSVGVMFNGLPKHELQQLNQTFSTLSNLRTSSEVTSSVSDSTPPPPPPPTEDSKTEDGLTWGGTISGKIDAGVTWMSCVLSSGTNKAGELLNKGGDKLRDNIEPREEPLDIPQPVEKGAFYARKVSGAVVGVSDFLMMTLARGTVAVGKTVGTIVAESDMVKGREINPHAKEAWKVTKSSAKGAGRVFGDLEKAAKAIIKGAGTETSKTVGHKYGEQAGRVSDDGLATAGNTVDLVSTYYSWKTWGISFLGKVGKVLAAEEEKDKVSTNDSVTQQQSVTVPPSCDSSVSSTVKSSVYIPQQPSPQPIQHKPKKELLYS